MGKSVWLASVSALLLAFFLPIIAIAPKITESQDSNIPLAQESVTRTKNDGNFVKDKSEITPALEAVRKSGPSDIPANIPAYDAASYLMYHKIMKGNHGAFEPYTMVTRGAAVMALYRFSGSKPPAEFPIFSDVDAPYAEATAWAVDAGIVQGFDGQQFGINQPINRGQLAVMLYRFAQGQGLTPETVRSSVSLESYLDGNAVPDYAKEALSWALGSGIFHTIVGKSILPHAPVSRLQLGQTLVALAGLQDKLAAEIYAAQPARIFESASQNNHEAIQAAIDAAAKRYGAMGVQVAVVENGALCDTYAYGWAVQNQTPMTADHKMRTASLSKVLVGISAMLLQEDGAVNLDESIGEYWGFPIQNPYYPNDPITLRSLLTHTSTFSAPDNADTSYDSIKVSFQRGEFHRIQPGAMTSWSYSNYGFAVLGLTLELAGKQHLDTLLQERLYQWMSIDAAFSGGDIQNTDLMAALYRAGGTVSWTAETQRSLHKKELSGTTGVSFAGGLTISAMDLGKITAMLASDGRYEGVQLLSEESVDIMESCQQIADGSYQALPMRYRSGIYGREGLYYHTGSAYGVYNCMSYDPNTKDGVVVLTTGASNVRDNNDIYSICAEITEYIYNVI